MEPETKASQEATPDAENKAYTTQIATTGLAAETNAPLASTIIAENKIITTKMATTGVEGETYASPTTTMVAVKKPFTTERATTGMAVETYSPQITTTVTESKRFTAEIATSGMEAETYAPPSATTVAENKTFNTEIVTTAVEPQSPEVETVITAVETEVFSTMESAISAVESESTTKTIKLKNKLLTMQITPATKADIPPGMTTLFQNNTILPEMSRYTSNNETIVGRHESHTQVITKETTTTMGNNIIETISQLINELLKFTILLWF